MARKAPMKFGTNPNFEPMWSICIGFGTFYQKWYICDGCGNELRDYAEYETKNGLAPVIWFNTYEQAVKFAAKIPSPPGRVWVDPVSIVPQCPDGPAGEAL